jgi:hypothetical protein
MAINITNIISVVNAKLAALDSNSTLEDIKRLNTINDYIVNVGGVLKYQAESYLPPSTKGSIAFVERVIEHDSSNTGSYFLGLSQDSGGWQRMFMTLDSADSAAVTPPFVYVPPVPPFGGTISGYTSGGSGSSNVIDKFSFVSDGNATDVGDLTIARQSGAGQSSKTFGYTSGGSAGPPVSPNTIDKFSFTSNGNATDVGDLTVARGGYVVPAGQSSDTFGYTSGGSSLNVIDKFAFTSDGNATDVGDLSTIRGNLSGQSSPEYGNGYTAGGNNPVVDTIDKFPFAADGNATDVANLTLARYMPSGQSSTTHGYASGGYLAPTQRDIIDKFSFASDADATDVGNLSIAKYDTAGQSSTTFGYTSGGNPAPTGQVEKFSFTSDGNTTSVGNLSTGARSAPMGQQV